MRREVREDAGALRAAKDSLLSARPLFDVVFLDAFVNEGADSGSPRAFGNPDWCADVRQIMSPNGLLVANTWTEDPVSFSLRRSCMKMFQDIIVFRPDDEDQNHTVEVFTVSKLFSYNGPTLGAWAHNVSEMWDISLSTGVSFSTVLRSELKTINGKPIMF